MKVKKVIKNENKTDQYMITSGIAILSMILSAILNDNNLIKESIRQGIISVGSTIVVMDNVYYFIDKLKYSLKNKYQL